MRRFKKLSILTIIFTIIINFCMFNITYAVNPSTPNLETPDSGPKITGDNFTLDKVIRGGKNFIESGEESVVDTSGLQLSSPSIFNILLTIGVALTVIVGGILGIKFIIASAEDKAQIKEMLIPYVVGCIVIYGAFGIWKLVVEIMGNIA